jgi:hypothetical protein
MTDFPGFGWQDLRKGCANAGGGNHKSHRPSTGPNGITVWAAHKKFTGCDRQRFTGLSSFCRKGRVGQGKAKAFPAFLK